MATRLIVRRSHATTICYFNGHLALSNPAYLDSIEIGKHQISVHASVMLHRGLYLIACIQDDGWDTDDNSRIIA